MKIPVSSGTTGLFVDKRLFYLSVSLQPSQSLVPHNIVFWNRVSKRWLATRISTERHVLSSEGFWLTCCKSRIPNLQTGHWTRTPVHRRCCVGQTITPGRPDRFKRVRRSHIQTLSAPAATEHMRPSATLGFCPAAGVNTFVQAVAAHDSAKNNVSPFQHHTASVDLQGLDPLSSRYIWATHVPGCPDLTRRMSVSLIHFPLLLVLTPLAFAGFAFCSFRIVLLWFFLFIVLSFESIYHKTRNRDVSTSPRHFHGCRLLTWV